MKSMEIPRLNLRRIRADSLASAVFNLVDRSLADDVNRKSVFNELRDLFFQNGIEVLSDRDREQIGLPPRGPEGWTIEELIELEKRKLELLRKPLVSEVVILK